MMDAPVLSYDFSQLKPANTGRYKEAEMDMVIDKAKRATPQIVEQIIQYARERKGVMIFAATVRHAQEIHGAGCQKAKPPSSLVTLQRQSAMRLFKLSKIAKSNTW
ncbi:DNA or RNA helicase [Vibrio parahaemolyticus AQ4037]|nr:DNA or RNA helicase [Vibrio parahaemolyticus AQ4037]